MKHIVPALVVLVIFSVAGSPAAACTTQPDPLMFQTIHMEDASPTASGLFQITYRHPAFPDHPHVSLHRIIQIFPDDESPIIPVVAQPTFVVLIDGSLGMLRYVIYAHPLYYGTTLDSTGAPQQLWLDAEEDGLNGNEEAQ